MALTVTRVAAPYSVGDRWESISAVLADNSYPTGGWALSRADLGFAATVDPEFDVRAQSQAGFIAEYDHTNSKLKLLTPVRAFTGTIDHASLASVTARDDAVTVTGVLATDVVVGFKSPDALEAKAIAKSARVSGADTVTVRLENSSAASIDPASGTYTFYVAAANGAAKEVANATDVSAAVTALRLVARGKFRQ